MYYRRAFLSLLKASKVQVSSDEYSSLPLLHRVAIGPEREESR